jgi:predicted secreted Zn-dependent protease
MSTRHNITSAWKKSSYSGGSGQCVEVRAPGADAIAVRDSKDPSGPSVGFTPTAWSTFIASVRHHTLTTG